LGHTYNIHRPADSQPYVVTSDNPLLTQAEESQIVAFSTLLDLASA